MPISWGDIFDKYGIKTVTKTDKVKAAYVPTADQQAAIAAAGVLPSEKRPADEFQIKLVNDAGLSVAASFYHSIRATDPSRTPEPRMGHEFISRWLQEGDRVVIGNIGSELFASKLAAIPPTEEQIRWEVARKADPVTIIARAKKAKGAPAKRTNTRDDYERNPYVVMAALVRSNGKCEMPGCGNALFLRDDDTPYLEVHHIVPLSEGGEDTYANVAALCPHCHREQHFGKLRWDRRAVLAGRISSII